MINEKWLEQGYIDEPIPEGIDVKAEIRRMCKQKNALIMAHYYTEGVIQELADFVGDSLALAQKAASTDADIIVMCGVHFMGEIKSYVLKRQFLFPTLMLLVLWLRVVLLMSLRSSYRLILIIR